MMHSGSGHAFVLSVHGIILSEYNTV
jgi:hypothetical protein